MNKDSWNIIFNKANDVSFLSVKELNKKIKECTQERDKKLMKKYEEFLDTLKNPELKPLFMKYKYSYKKVNSKGQGIDYVFGSDIILTVNLKENKINLNFCSAWQREVYCDEEDCHKTVEYMKWLEDDGEEHTCPSYWTSVVPS